MKRRAMHVAIQPSRGFLPRSVIGTPPSTIDRVSGEVPHNPRRASPALLQEGPLRAQPEDNAGSDPPDEHPEPRAAEPGAARAQEPRRHHEPFGTGSKAHIGSAK